MEGRGDGGQGDDFVNVDQTFMRRLTISKNGSQRASNLQKTKTKHHTKCVSVHEAAVHKFSVQKCSTEVCTNMKVTMHAPSSEDVCMQWCNAMFVVSAWGNRL